MVSYPLPVTTMPAQKLYKIQAPTTTLFLAKQGYLQTFPRAITYTSGSHRRLGFQDLRAEQGVQKFLQLIKHIQTNTMIRHVYGILIQQYQLMARFTSPILEFTKPVPWSSAPWIDTVHKFLQQIQGQIWLCQPWTPTPHEQHDWAIMDDIIHLNLPKNQTIQIINSVCLYLHIQNYGPQWNHTTITDANASKCIRLLLPPIPKQQQPLPAQEKPTLAEWHKWGEMMQWLYITKEGSILAVNH